MLVLITSGIGFSANIFIYFSVNKTCENRPFWLKIGDFSLKKNQTFGTKTYSTGCKDQHIQKWAKSDNLVMSYYFFHDFSQIAIFSMGCLFFSENHPYFAEFSLFCIFGYYFQKCLLNLCLIQFIAYLDLFLVN